jgi:hypothetical protein
MGLHRGFALAPVMLALALAPSLSACSEKASASEAKATSMLSAALDAGDGGVHANGDAGSAAEDVAMPSTSPQSTEELTIRMRHLLEAIAQNNSDLAGDALFPRDAFIAAKDGPDPQKLWEKKIAGNFRHQLERTHKHMKGIDHARFVSFELGHQIVQLTPKKKDFKRPLWRVKHSKLTFTIDGKTKHVDIAEMTAWRGAWYVTRLR